MLTHQQKVKRLGMITGSIMSTIMEGGPKAWVTLLELKKLEIEQPDEAIGDEVYAPSLDWGNVNEPKAIANYEIVNGVDAIKPDFMVHPSIPYVGCSPDFLTDEVVGEAKCPFNEEVHKLTVLYGTGADTYKPQVQTEIWVSEKPRCHFISFDPRYKDPEKQLIVIPVERDDSYIEEMTNKCGEFYDYLISDTRPEIGFTTEIPDLF